MNPISLVRRSRFERFRGIEAGGGLLESLEPRVLLSAYAFEDVGEAFDLPGVLGLFTPPLDVLSVGFGSNVAAIGDIDGDGYTDIAITAGGQQDLGGATIHAGRVFIYSGATRDWLRVLDDGFAGFGSSMANVGDINADGVPDLLVGSPFFDGDSDAAVNPTGAAYIYSGVDGSMLRMFTGESEYAEFGAFVGRFGDMDDDGHTEVIISAPGGGPTAEGRVYAVTTAEVAPGEEIVRTFTGASAGDRFGDAVHALGNVYATRGDPFEHSPFILVGAPLNDANGGDAGRAYLINVLEDEVTVTFTGTVEGDEFGSAVGVTQAGEETLLVISSPHHDFMPAGGFEPIIGSGRVDVYRTTGELYFDLPTWGAEGERYGETITSIGDIDGDGMLDLAITRALPISPDRAVDVRNANFHGIQPGHFVNGEFPSALFDAGDLDGDDASDLVAIGEGGSIVTSSSLALLPVISIFGHNDNLSFVFASSVGNRIGTRVDYAIVDGVFRTLRTLPGLTERDYLVGVNNRGDMVGGVEVTTTNPPGFLVQGEPFIVIDGVRTLLRDAVTEVIGGVVPDWSRMRPVKIGNDGSIILDEHLGPPGGDPTSVSHAWLFKDGVMELLWVGQVYDINDHGDLLGLNRDYIEQPPHPTHILRLADGQWFPVTGFASANRVNNNRVVVGVTFEGDLAVWENAMGRVVAPLPPLEQPTTSRWWEAFDISDEGVVSGRLNSVQGRGTFFENYIVPDGGEARKLQDILFGYDTFGGTPLPLTFAEGGRIVSTGGIMRPLTNEEAWSQSEDGPMASARSDAGSVVVGINLLDELILLREVDGEFRASRLSLPIQSPGSITGIQAYYEEQDGRAYIAVFTSTSTYWGAINDDGQWIANVLMFDGEFSSRTLTDTTLFLTSDERVVMAGLNEDGEVALIFQENQGLPDGAHNWRYSNLVDAHLPEHGQTFVPVASNLTGFSTPWGSQHVAYLDGLGNMHFLWWSSDSPWWRTDPVVSTTGFDQLRGNLTSFVTPWNTLHVNAFNSAGQAVAVWWAPGFGGFWVTSTLVQDSFSVALLQPSSVSAFVTPWSALNIVGRDIETGEMLVYWWTPETNAWRADRLTVVEAPEDFTTTGHVQGRIDPDGRHSLFGRQAGDGHVVRVGWSMQDPQWRYTDITEEAAP